MNTKKIAALSILGLTLGATSVVAYVNHWFEPRRSWPTGLNPIDVKIIDLNQDSHPDIITANRSDRTFGIFLGDGSGEFTEWKRVKAGPCPASIDASDLNKDGWMDIVVGEVIDGKIAFYSGSKDGNYERTHEVEVGGAPYNVTLGDFDEDGFPDVVASDFPGHRLIVVLSGKDQDYTQFDDYQTGTQTIAVRVTDLNQDGHLDLLSADQKSATVSIFMGLGDGRFSAETPLQVEPLPYSLAVGNFTGDDSIPDIAVAHSSAPSKISIFQGLEGGRFDLAKTIQDKDPLIYITSSDVDGNGLMDLITAHNQSPILSIFLGMGDEKYNHVPMTIPAINHIYALELADLNHDKILDYVTVDYDQNTLSIALGNPNRFAE